VGLDLWFGGDRLFVQANRFAVLPFHQKWLDLLLPVSKIRFSTHKQKIVAEKSSL
jgi:hypothetical protein